MVTSLQERVRLEIRDYQLLRPRQRVLVAVSGGVDSMVLLHLLAASATQEGWNLTVAHLNHHLRGHSSAADEALVRRVAKKLGLPIVVGHADVKGISRENKISIEMAARKARHRFLAGTARKLKVSSIALAHHADDQVELFFIRLFHGSGPDGLAGMKWASPSPVAPEIRLVRPLLGQSKCTLLEFAAENRIEYREDASNASIEIARNRIRHELLPVLRTEYQPALRESTLRVMSIIEAEADLIADLADQWMLVHGLRSTSQKSVAPRGDFSGTDFNDLPVALQRRIIYGQLMAKNLAADFDLVERLRLRADAPQAVRDLVNTANATNDPPRGILVRRDRSGRVKLAEMPAAIDFDPALKCVDLRSSEKVITFEGLALWWQFETKKGLSKLKQVTGAELFDADRVGNTVILRHWRAGDRFQPIGMDRAVKLQDLFVNQKVPRVMRRTLILATTATDDIFWVEGLRISNGFKLTNDTRRRLRWQWRRG